MKRFYGLPLFILLLSGYISQAQAVLITNTDDTWRVTASAPGADWNTDISFDDSGWELATEYFTVQDYHSEYDPATKGIWTSGGQFSTTETNIWARKIFNLAEMPLTAELKGAFDDDGEIYINGFLVLIDNDNHATDLFIADITPYLVIGANLISYHALDEYLIWGYNHTSYMELTGTVSNVPEPATLLLLVSGLLGLTLGRRAVV